MWCHQCSHHRVCWAPSPAQSGSFDLPGPRVREVVVGLSNPDVHEAGPLTVLLFDGDQKAQGWGSKTQHKQNLLKTFRWMSKTVARTMQFKRSTGYWTTCMYVLLASKNWDFLNKMRERQSMRCTMHLRSGPIYIFIMNKHISGSWWAPNLINYRPHPLY